MEELSDIRFLQIICGVWFIPHVVGKIRHAKQAVKNFESFGFVPGQVFVPLAIGLEILAFLGLAFGIQPHLASLCATAVLLGAAGGVVRGKGWNWRWQFLGPEYLIFWAIVCLYAGFGSFR